MARRFLLNFFAILEEILNEDQKSIPVSKTPSLRAEEVGVGGKGKEGVRWGGYELWGQISSSAAQLLEGDSLQDHHLCMLSKQIPILISMLDDPLISETTLSRCFEEVSDIFQASIPAHLATSHLGNTIMLERSQVREAFPVCSSLPDCTSVARSSISKYTALPREVLMEIMERSNSLTYEFPSILKV